jgi:hypothetical protein
VIFSLKTIFGIEFGTLLLLREKAYLPPVTMETLGAMVDKRREGELGLYRVPQVLNRESCKSSQAQKCHFAETTDGSRGCKETVYAVI